MPTGPFAPTESPLPALRVDLPRARGRKPNVRGFCVPERGLALVSVLWALSILSLIAASIISTGTLSATIERNALRRAQANAAADAAIALGIVGLLDPRTESQRRLDGVRQTVSFAGTEIEVSIQDQNGLIDLNEADVSLLRGLFASAGLKADEAARFAGRIIDWRTGGDIANFSDYWSKGLHYGPRNGPFQSVDEVKLIPGMTPEVFGHIAPALTVHSHPPSIYRNTATQEILLAVPGMDQQQAEAIVTERRSGGTAGFAFFASGRAVSLRAVLENRGREVRKELIVRFTGERARPYMVLAWN